MLKPYPALITLIFALLGLFIHVSFPAFAYPSFICLSIICAVVGIFLIAWAIYFFRRNKTTVMPFETPKKFINEGPFKYSRNPIYLGMLLILAGVYVFIGNPLNLIPLVAFVGLMSKLIILNEEKVLEREFRSEYLEYKRSVSRWFL